MQLIETLCHLNSVDICRLLEHIILKKMQILYSYIYLLFEQRKLKIYIAYYLYTSNLVHPTLITLRLIKTFCVQVVK